MRLSLLDLQNFYASSLGRRVRRILTTTIRKRWSQSMSDHCVYCAFGYPLPFLKQEKSELPFIFMPMGQGAIPWEGNTQKNRVILCEEEMLPLPDKSVDRILLIHWLEGSDDPRKSLREVWRILKDNGRLLLIVPNRRSLWAAKDTTPFGMGGAFSFSQVVQLLKETFFMPLDVKGALYMPPMSSLFLQSFSPLIERFGEKGFWFFGGIFAGVWVIDAEKQVCAGVLETSIRLQKGQRIAASYGQGSLTYKK